MSLLCRDAQLTTGLQLIHCDAGRMRNPLNLISAATACHADSSMRSALLRNSTRNLFWALGERAWLYVTGRCWRWSCT